MATDKAEILEGLKESIVNYDFEKATRLAKKAIAIGIDAKEAITLGLSAGMSQVGEKYQRQEMYLPEVMAASKAMYAALDILIPYLKAEGNGTAVAAKKVVICTVEGDVHSIGKTIVGTLLKVNGYEVNDLGADVPLEKIIQTAETSKADMIAMSTLMTSTMAGMKDVMKMLKDRGLRGKYKVAVGGAPVNEDFRKLIGADMTADNADRAVQATNGLFGVK